MYMTVPLGPIHIIIVLALILMIMVNVKMFRKFIRSVKTKWKEAEHELANEKRS